MRSSMSALIFGLLTLRARDKVSRNITERMVFLRLEVEQDRVHGLAGRSGTCVHFGASGLLGKLNSRSNLLPKQSSQIGVVRLKWEAKLPNLTTLGSLSASRSSEDPRRQTFRSTPLR